MLDILSPPPDARVCNLYPLYVYSLVFPRVRVSLCAFLPARSFFHSFVRSLYIFYPGTHVYVLLRLCLFVCV